MAIIGGGIAGVATALELADLGVRVALFEKGRVAAEQSSRNWGWVRQMGRDPRELPLMRISIGLWRSLQQRLGEDVGFRECGIAYLCRTEKELSRRRLWFDSNALGHELSSHMLDSDQARSLAPQTMVGWKGGLYTPDDARAEPTLAVPAMARAAKRQGVKIFQNCAVRSLARQNGKVTGIVTERGQVGCDAVVLAGGAWSRRFCRNLKIELPLLTVTGSAMRTAPIDAGIDPSIAGSAFAIRKRLDGGYTVANPGSSIADVTPDSFRLFAKFWPLLKNEWQDFRYRIGPGFVSECKMKSRWAADEASPFEQQRILDPKPSRKILEQSLRALRRTFPEFQEAAIVEQWAGMIDVTPDAIPVISAVPQAEGFYIIAGFSGHGFGLGPGAGKLMAQMISGQTCFVDPTAFRFERFEAGKSG